jgi:sugar lactone lactonase YvrE
MDTVSHSVIRLDDRLDAVVDPGASVQKVLEDHSAFFEGPVWIDTPDGGHLLFTDIAGDAILRWEPNGRIHVVASSFFATTPASVARELDLGSRSVVLKGPDGLAIDR